MYEKTDKTGLYRDMSTGAIVNQDVTALEAYRRKKQQAREVQTIQERQDRIETELHEIKDLLRNALTCVGKNDQ